MRSLFQTLALLLALIATAPAAIESKILYKRVGFVRLRLHVIAPDDWKPTDQRPSAVIFFGGGWLVGEPKQFYPQARYLASRGMVVILPEYRVKYRNNTRPFRSVMDAKSAMRYVRSHASELGIDPNRIAGSGASAGGHLALCTAMVPGMDEPTDDLSVSCVPNAMILLNPIIALAPTPGMALSGIALPSTDKRFGVSPEVISPVHHLSSGLPPTLMMHGNADTIVSYESVLFFQAKMQALGNRCELVTYDKQGHGFFNFRWRQIRTYGYSTLTDIERFLFSLGWLNSVGNPRAFFAANPPFGPGE